MRKRLLCDRDRRNPGLLRLMFQAVKRKMLKCAIYQTAKPHGLAFLGIPDRSQQPARPQSRYGKTHRNATTLFSVLSLVAVFFITWTPFFGRVAL